MVLVCLSYPLKKNQGGTGESRRHKFGGFFFLNQQPTLPIKKRKENSLDNQSSNVQDKCWETGKLIPEHDKKAKTLPGREWEVSTWLFTHNHKHHQLRGKREHLNRTMLELLHTHMHKQNKQNLHLTPEETTTQNIKNKPWNF